MDRDKDAIDWLRQARILMAEDNQINQKLATMLFAREGCEIAIVSNGAEALAKIREENFDMVLMDVQMPVMDGLEATTRIKGEMGEKAPMIVALTANAMPGDEERFIEAGMDHYMSKPIDFTKLKELLLRLTPSN